jgi:hypothetical protein
LDYSKIRGGTRNIPFSDLKIRYPGFQPWLTSVFNGYTMMAMQV